MDSIFNGVAPISSGQGLESLFARLRGLTAKPISDQKISPMDYREGVPVENNDSDSSWGQIGSINNVSYKDDDGGFPVTTTIDIDFSNGCVLPDVGSTVNIGLVIGSDLGPLHTGEVLWVYDPDEDDNCSPEVSVRFTHYIPIPVQEVHMAQGAHNGYDPDEDIPIYVSLTPGQEMAANELSVSEKGQTTTEKVYALAETVRELVGGLKETLETQNTSGIKLKLSNLFIGLLSALAVEIDECAN